MAKLRRTALTGIVTPLPKDEPLAQPVAPAALVAHEGGRRRNATRETTIQQTVYLPPAVHEQLRELAFSERVRMHALIMEGLDDVFRARGLKPIAELIGAKG